MYDTLKYLLAPALGGGLALFAIYLKSRIDQKQYSLRLKMEKLEELYKTLYEIKKYTGIGNSMIMATFSGEKSVLEQEWDHYGLYKALMLSRLYLPESKELINSLEQSIDSYRERYRGFLVAICSGDKFDENMFNNLLKKPLEALECSRAELVRKVEIKAEHLLK